MGDYLKGFTIVQWLFAGIIFVIVDKVNEKYFKNREENRKEMEFNDKYVEKVVMNTKTVGQQMELAKYYSCITVQSDVREGWLNYFRLKKSEYDSNEFKRIQLTGILFRLTHTRDNLIVVCSENPELFALLKGFQSLARKDTLDVDMRNEIISYIRTKIEYFEKQQKIEIPNSAKQELDDVQKKIFIQFTSKISRDSAKAIQKLLVQNKWSAPGVDSVSGSLNDDVIKYFYKEDEGLANDAATIFSKSVNIKTLYTGGYGTKVPRGQLELWIGKK